MKLAIFMLHVIFFKKILKTYDRALRMRKNND